MGDWSEEMSLQMNSDVVQIMDLKNLDEDKMHHQSSQAVNFCFAVTPVAYSFYVRRPG